MPNDEKAVKPDVVIELTDEQIAEVQFLHNIQHVAGKGLILGSLGIEGKTIALSYIPYESAKKIVDFAYRELGENNHGNS